MRVLITGAAGFIGSHLAGRLVEHHEVVGIDNLLTGRTENFPGDLVVDDVLTWYDGRAYDLILHCAASYSDPENWQRDAKTNVQGAARIGQIARTSGARVVYFQTVLPPTSSYAISKLAGEQYLRLSGVPLLVVKLANVYGPRGLNGPVAAFAKRLLAGEPCTITDTSRDFVYVDTVCEHVLRSIETEQVGTMTLRSGRETPIREVYELVAAMLNIDGGVQYLPRAIGDVAAYAAYEFNGEPPVLDVSLRFGIGETVAWYREHGVGETYTHLRVGA